MKKEKRAKKSFVWNGLRVGFWVMIASFFTGFLFENQSISVSAATVTLLWIISSFFTFVVSIIHLTKYKEKPFAITALTISSIMILFFFLSIIVALSKLD
ncbi:MAG: hypothetical protein WDZ77_00115 [Candidatus Pacearchaeota archaeon]